MTKPDPSVLLVADGSEVVRQSHADTVSLFREVLSTGPFRNTSPTLRVAHESQADGELAGVTVAEYQCIVFASNALLRSDGPIVEACLRRADDLERYLESGGSIVILHQSIGPSIGTEPYQLLKGVLAGGVWTTQRKSFDSALRLSWTEAAAALKSHPNLLAEEDYAERRPGAWRASFPLAYQYVEAQGNPDEWEVIAESEIGPLILTHQGRGRVVVTSLPLDWGREIPLLQNIIQYGIFGLPIIASVISDGLEQPLHLDLARLGAQYPVVNLADFAELDELPSAILRNLQLIIDLTRNPVSSKALNTVLESGGQAMRLVHPPNAERTTSLSVNLEIGPRSSIWIAEAALGNYLDLDLPQFVQIAPLFDIRDVLLALPPIFEAIDQPTAYLTTEASLRLRERCRDWLATGQARVDQFTALICLSLWCKAIGSDPASEEVLHHLELLPDQNTPEACLVREALLFHLVGSSALDDAWMSIARSLETDEPSVGSIVRILDAARVSIQLLGAFPSDGVDLEVIADRAARNLLEAGDSDGLWISTEATASIVAGLAILAGPQPQNAVIELFRRTLESLSPVLDPLLPHVPTTTRLQVAGALVMLEKAYGTGLRDLAIALLRSGPPTTAPASWVQQNVNRLVAAEDATGQLEDALRGAHEESSRRLTSLTEESEAREVADRPAVLLGRSAYTAALATVTAFGLAPVVAGTVAAIMEQSLAGFAQQDYQTLAVLPAVPLMIAAGKRLRLLLVPERFLRQPDSQSPDL